ncbi:RluA family pseudouridine synthase [Metabacillus dongyingensis]|uniref:RluA family pseudouridine synthase n=1 Tax=Metabacillus dongyingensis TaxID=2874282 RepID=UPI001CBF1BD1|nr:RluA family pseudouridine synthase [Metabacillus dongyingensis]UAL53339.1 RluA family pseudouridine synthase [Metabacillus dongyingensis]
MNAFQLTWTIPAAEEGMLIRDYLKEKNISKRALTDIKFGGGCILVNGEHATVRFELKSGDVLKVIFPVEKPSSGMLPEKVNFDIVYEDEWCLVINKPPYLPTIPSREHPGGTLANGLLFYYGEKGIDATIHVVNRLDKDTSGLMLVAKHRFAHSLFSSLQKQGGIRRTYAALVEGKVLMKQGTISAPIGRKEDSIIERTVRDDGKLAVTHYHVIAFSECNTLVSLKLETGRTHQIRVHMSHIGHPLSGDSLYGGSHQLLSRQALHSAELSFFHPFLEKEMNFKIDLPNDIQSVINKKDSC